MQCYVYGEKGEGAPWLAQRLLDPQLMGEQVMWPAGRRAAGLYRALAAKQTGRLAASARPQLTIGGQKMDRIVVDVVSGEDLPRGGYGASHEFGIGRHPRSRVPPTSWMPQKAVNDWVKVLAFMQYESGLQRSFYTLDVGVSPAGPAPSRPRARRPRKARTPYEKYVAQRRNYPTGLLPQPPTEP